MANRSARTPEKEREFLDALAAGLSVTKSSLVQLKDQRECPLIAISGR